MVVLVLGVAQSRCAAPLGEHYRPAPGEPRGRVHLVDHGWHTGIVVRRADLPGDVWPEHRLLPPSEYVEVGWGDRDFYLAPRGTVWLALKASFWSTSSVLHVVGFDGPLDRIFGEAEIVEVPVSPEGLRRLALFIQEAYARNADGGVIPVAGGQGASRFYAGRERYSLLRTCNTWAARALREAGLPITPSRAVTAASVMEQVRRAVQVGQDGGPGTRAPRRRAR